MCYELFKTRYKNLLNFLPFTFLLIGTFSGMNLNFYLIILSYFGLASISKKRINIVDYIYFGFSIIWLLNIQSNDYFPVREGMFLKKRTFLKFLSSKKV